jgi:hypothetical protein
MSEKPRRPWEVDPERATQELRDMDNEFIQRYKPVFLGAGGEHVVFGIPGRERTVFKVLKHSLWSTIQENIAAGKPITTMPEYATPEAVDAYLEREWQRFRTFKRYFPDSTLQEKVFVTRVPITRSLIQELAPHLKPEEINIGDGEFEVPAIVRVQEKVDLESLQNKTSFHWKYIEYKEQSETELLRYERLISANVDLVEGEEYKEHEIDCTHEVARLLVAAKNDASLKKALQDFVTRAISYTTEVGDMLDLAGDNNVVFYKDGGAWKYLCVDAMYPSDESWTLSKEAVAIWNTGEDLDNEERHAILNGINYARTLNQLAIQLGLSCRLSLSDTPLSPRSRELHSMLRDLLKEK